MAVKLLLERYIHWVGLQCVQPYGPGQGSFKIVNNLKHVQWRIPTQLLHSAPPPEPNTYYSEDPYGLNNYTRPLHVLVFLVVFGLEVSESRVFFLSLLI